MTQSINQNYDNNEYDDHYEYVQHQSPFNRKECSIDSILMKFKMFFERSKRIFRRNVSTMLFLRNMPLFYFPFSLVFTILTRSTSLNYY